MKKLLSLVLAADMLSAGSGPSFPPESSKDTANSKRSGTG